MTCDSNGAPQIRGSSIETYGGPETIKIGEFFFALRFFAMFLLLLLMCKATDDVTIQMRPDAPRILSDVKQDSTSYLSFLRRNQARIIWGIFGTPPLKAEPPFKLICARTSRRIWHKIALTFECSGPGAEPRLTGRGLR